MIGGWLAQALIVAISLLVACRMSRITGDGIKQVIEAEEDARRAREMLQLIMDNIPQQIYWKDTQLRLSGLQPQLRPRRRAGGPGGDHREDGLRPALGQRGRGAAARRGPARHGRRTSPSTTSWSRPPHADGRQSWAATNRIPLHDALGGVVGILGTIEDITEQRQAEEALRESDARLRTVIAGIPVMVYALDRHGIFTFCDGKGLEALGLEPGQVVGRTAYDVFRDTPALLDHLHVALTGIPHAWTVEVQGPDARDAGHAAPRRVGRADRDRRRGL